MVSNMMTRRRALLKDETAVIPPEPSGDPWYGVDWFYSNSSPQLTRIGSATNFSDPQPATSVSGSGSSPFDNIMPWAGMKRYNIINGVVSYSQDDAGFSQTDYDTVVYIPEFYYRAEKDTTEQRWTWAISPTAQEGFTKHPGSGRYVGRYHTSGDSNGVFSKSGVMPLVNTTRAKFRTYSHSKGANWYMLDIATWSALQMLYLVEFANFDSQTKLGTGWVVGSAAVSGGGTDNAAYHTLEISAGHNQYRWIEDPFSNCDDWIDGYVGSTSATYAAASETGYSGGTAGLNNLGFALSDSGSIRGFGYSDKAPWAFIPDASDSGDSVYSTYVCDRVIARSATSPVGVGGNYNANAGFGFFYFYEHSDAYTGAYLGSRLLFIP